MFCTVRPSETVRLRDRGHAYALKRRHKTKTDHVITKPDVTYTIQVYQPMSYATDLSLT